MLFVKINSRICAKYPRVLKLTCRAQSVAASNKEVAELPAYPAYPQILDLEFRARYERDLYTWHEHVKNVGTVEEKMIKVNMPRYYGFKCLMVEEGQHYYNSLPYAQYITRTYIPEDNKLPAYYDNLIPEETLNSLTKEIKEAFVDGVEFELCNRLRHQEHSKDFIEGEGVLDDLIGDAVCKQVNRIMLGNLGQRYQHLIDIQLDIEPRIESFWFFGGIDHSLATKKSFEIRFRDYAEKMADFPVDRIFQYIGKPVMQLRHQLPLKEIMPMEECENSSFDIPEIRYDPRTVGYAMKRRHITSIPGFWPGDQSEFGLVSYHKQGYLERKFHKRDDDIELLKTQAVFAHWGWLTSLAFNLGFSTFNQITYPLVNQSVITNGRSWTFSTYQLNTNKLCVHEYKNPKKNICWITEPMQLFEKIEDGKLVGINDDVLKNLIKFYVNAPAERVGVNMKPYLNPEEPRIAFIADRERREWLEKNYKHLVSNRPRSRRVPEMFHWQRIYQFQFQTMPFEKRRSHWDFGINPFLRRLDEHQSQYVPKALRPGKKVYWNKDKMAKTYYPK